MKTTLSILICFTLTATLSAQTSVAISELEFLNNTSWEGHLMYVNYGDGKEVNLRTTMQIEIQGDQLLMQTQFTDEPSANSVDTIKLKKGGTYLGNELIIKREDLADGTIEILTRFEGKDANQPATMFKTYRINESEITISKRVKFERSEKELIRNRYTYTISN